MPQGHDQAAERVVEDAAVDHVIRGEFVPDQFDARRRPSAAGRCRSPGRPSTSKTAATAAPEKTPSFIRPMPMSIRPAREETAAQEEPDGLVPDELAGPMLDDPEVTAAIDRHLLVPILGLLLGVGQRSRPRDSWSRCRASFWSAPSGFWPAFSGPRPGPPRPSCSRAPRRSPSTIGTRSSRDDDAHDDQRPGPHFRKK